MMTHERTTAQEHYASDVREVRVVAITQLCQTPETTKQVCKLRSVDRTAIVGELHLHYVSARADLRLNNPATKIQNDVMKVTASDSEALDACASQAKAPRQI